MDKFVKEDIATDLGLGIGKTPSVLSVKYGDVEVSPGAEITPTQAQHMPEVSWKAEEKAYYTLIMIDPDVPSRDEPKFREWQHWLVTNIPGCQTSKGEHRSAYIGAGPQKGTGLHRYVFILFKQPHGRQLFPGVVQLYNNSGVGRKSCKVAVFAERHNLGNPVAWNFFVAQWDPFVFQLYRQLSGKPVINTF